MQTPGVCRRNFSHGLQKRRGTHGLEQNRHARDARTLQPLGRGFARDQKQRCIRLKAFAQAPPPPPPQASSKAAALGDNASLNAAIENPDPLFMHPFQYDVSH